MRCVKAFECAENFREFGWYRGLFRPNYGADFLFNGYKIRGN